MVRSEQWVEKETREFPYICVLASVKLVWNGNIWKLFFRIHGDQFASACIKIGNSQISLHLEVEVGLQSWNVVLASHTTERCYFDVTLVQPANILTKKNISVSWLALCWNSEVSNRTTRNPLRLFCQLNNARWIISLPNSSARWRKSEIVPGATIGLCRI
jgi:hypothetical protein